MSNRGRHTLGLLALALFSPQAFAATFIVTSALDGTGDDCTGGCTLRQAILDANARPGTDTIEIRSNGVLGPGSPLPVITDRVHIDARVAEGYDGTPQFRLFGTGSSPDGLVFGSGSALSTVSGIAFGGFSGRAMVLRGSANGVVVSDNWFGVVPAGAGLSAASNRVHLRVETDSNLIGGGGSGNVFGAAIGNAIEISGDGNLVIGNLIGNPAAELGEAASGTVRGLGLSLTGNDNRIGSLGGRNRFIGILGGALSAIGARNTIVGNRFEGNQGADVALSGEASIVGGPGAGEGNEFIDGERGLHVGVFLPVVNAQVIGNSWSGMRGEAILLAGGSDDALVERNTISGAETGIRVATRRASVRGNRIWRARQYAIRVLGDDVVVIGNFIGTDESGRDLGGSLLGISIEADRAELEDNVVGFHPAPIELLSSRHSSLCNNHIGVLPGSLLPIPNGAGVFIENGVGLVLGQAGSCAGNVIGNNGYGIAAGGLQASVLQGNHVGIAADGSSAPNASSGIFISDPLGANLLRDNVVAFNAGDGIVIEGGGEGNSLEGNRLFGNAGLAIDIGFDGRTRNDEGDLDEGTNRLQNHPMLGNLMVSADQARLDLRVDTPTTQASYPLTVELFLIAADGVDMRSIATVSIPAAQAGLQQSLTAIALPAGTAAGRIVAIATDAVGNASELSDPIAFGLPALIFGHGFELPAGP